MKRYERGFLQMEEDPKGTFVLHTDYAALLEAAKDYYKAQQEVERTSSWSIKEARMEAVRSREEAGQRLRALIEGKELP